MKCLQHLLFDALDLEGRVAGDGQLDHLGALIEGLEAIRLVGVIAGGDEPDLIELSLLAALLGHDQVAEVDRIEGPAEDAQAR